MLKRSTQVKIRLIRDGTLTALAIVVEVQPAKFGHFLSK